MCDSTCITSVNYRKEMGYDKVILTVIRLEDESSMDFGSGITVPVIRIPDVPASLIRTTVEKQLYDYFLEKFETDLKYSRDIYTSHKIKWFANQATVLTLENTTLVM